METIMQSFEDGFGPLPLTTEHKKLLDYLPSEEQSTIHHAIMKLINENPNAYLHNYS
jgi:hypothetical protein